MSGNKRRDSMPDVMGAKKKKREPARAVSVPPATPSRWGERLRSFAGLVLVTGLAIFAAYGARRYVISSPRFAVKEANVDGCKHRTREEVVARAGIQLGKNIFLVDLDGARSKLMADPWIADATLARQLPGEVMIVIEEREAVAIVSMGDTWLVTRDGEPFKKMEASESFDLPIITGIDPADLKTDRAGVVSRIKRALDLASDYEKRRLALRSRLQEIHLEASGGTTLVVGRDGLLLVLGPSPWRRKLDQAVSVVSELDRRNVKATAILLDNEARPDRVVARLREPN